MKPIRSALALMSMTALAATSWLAARDARA